jgi:hypothetical protein
MIYAGCSPERTSSALGLQQGSCPPQVCVRGAACGQQPAAHVPAMQVMKAASVSLVLPVSMCYSLQPTATILQSNHTTHTTQGCRRGATWLYVSRGRLGEWEQGRGMTCHSSWTNKHRLTRDRRLTRGQRRVLLLTRGVEGSLGGMAQPAKKSTQTFQTVCTQLSKGVNPPQARETGTGRGGVTTHGAGSRMLWHCWHCRRQRMTRKDILMADGQPQQACAAADAA